MRIPVSTAAIRTAGPGGPSKPWAVQGLRHRGYVLGVLGRATPHRVKRKPLPWEETVGKSRSKNEMLRAKVDFCGFWWFLVLLFWFFLNE